jgi:hypothetical protein
VGEWAATVAREHAGLGEAKPLFLGRHRSSSRLAPTDFPCAAALSCRARLWGLGKPPWVALELLLYTCISRTSCKNAMATAPIRPKAYANWLTEVTATTPAPADARRHALSLWPGCAALHTLVSNGVGPRAVQPSNVCTVRRDRARVDCGIHARTSSSSATATSRRCGGTGKQLKTRCAMSTLYCWSRSCSRGRTRAAGSSQTASG